MNNYTILASILLILSAPVMLQAVSAPPQLLVSHAAKDWDPTKLPVETIFSYEVPVMSKWWKPLITVLVWDKEHPDYIVLGATRALVLLSVEDGKPVWAKEIPVRRIEIYQAAWAGDTIAVTAGRKKYYGSFLVNQWNTSLIVFSREGEALWVVNYTGQPLLATSQGHGLIAVVDARVSPLGGLRGVTLESQEIMVYNTRGDLVWNYTFPKGYVVDRLEWSPSGDYLLVKTLVVDNPSSNALLKVKAVRYTIFSHDGRKVWDETLQGDTTMSKGEWSPAGDVLAIVYINATRIEAQLLHMAARGGGVDRVDRAVVGEAGEKEFLALVTWRPPGDRLLVGITSLGEEGRIIAIDPETLKTVETYTPVGGVTVFRPKWSSDGKLAFAASHRTITLFNSRLDVIAEYQAPFLHAFTWSPKGGHVLAVRAEKTSRLELLRIHDFGILLVEKGIAGEKAGKKDLGYTLCIEGAPGQWCLPRKQGPSPLPGRGAGNREPLRLYLEPGSYTVRVKITWATGLDVKGPLAKATAEKPLEATVGIEAYNVSRLSIYRLLLARTGTLEFYNRASLTTRITVEWPGTGPVAGLVLEPGENSTLRLIDGNYDVKASARIQYGDLKPLTFSYTERIRVDPGTHARIVIDNRGLGIGELRVLPPARTVIATGEGRVVAIVEARDRPRTVYLPGGEYRATITPGITLLDKIIGPTKGLRVNITFTVKPGQSYTLNTTRALEAYLTPLYIANRGGEAARLLIVPEENGKPLEAIYVSIRPGGEELYLLVPGYTYRVIDAKTEKQVAVLEAKPGKTLRLTLGGGAANVETKTGQPSQPVITTQTTTTSHTATTTTTSGKPGGQTPANTQTGGGGQQTTILVTAAIILAIIAAAIILLRRR